MSKCFSGLCPNIKSRYRLSRKAEEAATTFDDLIKESQFDRVGYLDVPEAILHTDFETFKSREKLFNDIMDSLKVPTTSMIGVYGMPGVGKTSLAKEVERKLREVKLFDTVVMVTVSQTPDIQRIQDEIAESLGLKLEEKTTVGRAQRLCERLIQEKNPEKKQEKRILIILDDIWKKLDLNEVGIPFGSQQKVCTILLTSRNKHVVSNGMGATKIFQLDDLDDKEAWEFFKKMAGDSFESNEELRSTANEVAKRCAGLPLAISTVARALQNKELFVWKEALRQLQRPYSENPSEISAEVYRAVELSFNQLPSEDLKKTFLIWSLLRRDTRIEDLLRYAIGLGLINGVNTLEEARNNLLTKLSYLKEACLLIHSDTDTSEKYWDVHDLTYIVAKSIASKDYQMFSLGKEDDRTELPDGESMKKCNQFWLLYPTINKLPDQLNCPQLDQFLLYSKDHSLTLPADFFKKTTNLKVLALSSMQFSSLPSSVCLLTSLSTLSLDRCKFGADITIIGGLKSLEILSLLKSDIRILPKEIGQLVKLKLLDVSGCAKLKTISPGVMSCLTRLEELYMGGTCIHWGQSSTASLAELNTLSRLSTLEVQIQEAKAAPRNFFEGMQKLERYKIFIGDEWEWERECKCFGNYQYSRIINLGLSTSIDDLDRGIKKLLKKTQDLHLDELKCVKIALQELTDEQSLSHLKNLHIQNGLDTEYITNDGIEFPQLQSLTLQNLPQLLSFCPQHEASATSSLPQQELSLFSEKISFPCLEKLWLKSINVTRVWHHQLSTASFRSYDYEKLTTLKIEGCGSLKHLFSFSMAQCLVHLTDLEIIGCHCLREVIFMEAIEEETPVTLTLFPQLKSLELKDLLHLIGFCFDSQSQTQVIEFPAMRSMTIENCPELEGFICASSTQGNQRISNQVLFDNKVAFPNVEEISIFNLTKLKMIWHNPLPTNSFLKLREINVFRLSNLKYIWKNDSNGGFSFKNLRQLFVGDCWSLKNVFPVSVARDLPQLSDLYITGCGVEEIVSKGEDSETSLTFEFEQLSSLMLCGLPECKCFYPGRHATKWPMLKELEAYECGEMKIFDMQLEQLDSPPPLFLVEKVIRKLQRLELGIDDITTIHGEELGIYECEVKELFCTDNKGNLGSSSASFQNLTTLEVGECREMKYLDTCLAVQGLSQLKKLIIKECISVMEIVASEEDETTCQVNFNRLKSMELVNLPRLKSFCWGNHRFGFPCLEEVIVRGCPELEIFCKGGLNAPLLQRVEYGEGKGHWSGDLDSTVQHLHSTKVWCQGMGCFILSEFSKSIEIWKEKSLDFKNLMVLEVDKCNSLKYIFSASMVLDLVQLEQIIVKKCPTMEYIIKKGAEETAMDTVYLPKLETIILESCLELKSFCMGPITLQCPSLTTITVEDCPEMYAMACTREVGGGEKTPFFNDKVNESVTEEDILFTRLQLLEISGLPKLGTFWHGGDNSETDSTTLFNQKVVFPRLSHLTIQGIGKCGKIWDDEATNTMYSFYELTHLIVEDCARLLNILPLYMVERLEKLDTVSIWECGSLEEIIGPNNEDRPHPNESTKSIELKSTTKFVFPKLQTLLLGLLPKLKGFYSKLHTTEWPSLKQLEVNDCSKVETLAGEYINFQETQGQSSQPLFWVTQETFPNLQELDLTGNGNMKEIWHGPLPNQYFFNLTSLELTSVTIPNCFIQSFPNLEKLSVESAATNDLFPSLVPSSVSFKHLTTLEVSQCHGFRNLVTFTTAKSMVQLTRMTVTDCEMLEEIIASTTDEVTDDIFFSQLKSLELDCLPTLSRFCSGKCTLEFPSLEQVIIRQCPKIKFFTKGNLSTPMLHGLHSTEDEYVGHWEGNLNVTLQQLFVEKGIPSLEDLELSSINIQLVWKHKLLPARSYAQNLTYLTIEGCHNFNRMFSSSMVKSFVQLKKLKVENCENVENVIFVKELAKEEMMNQKTFRVLEFLSLKDLPKLTRFCHGNYFEFPLLTSLCIETCPTLKTFISNAEGNNSEIASPTLFNEKVTFPCLKELTIIGVGNWRTIWQQHPANGVRIHFANCSKVKKMREIRKL
ncbi:hypothetical protein GQ457_02G035290 [Hibiscus cannabinus]